MSQETHVSANRTVTNICSEDMTEKPLFYAFWSSNTRGARYEFVTASFLWSWHDSNYYNILRFVTCFLEDLCIVR